eukprot:3941944-Rhodomonas_salina.5
MVLRDAPYCCKVWAYAMPRTAVVYGPMRCPGVRGAGWYERMLPVASPMVLRACYAMSATEAGFAAIPMRRAVLRYAMLLHAMRGDTFIPCAPQVHPAICLRAFGTDIAYGAICLRASYALSSTDLAYGAMTLCTRMAAPLPRRPGELSYALSGTRIA